MRLSLSKQGIKGNLRYRAFMYWAILVFPLVSLLGSVAMILSVPVKLLIPVQIPTLMLLLQITIGAELIAGFIVFKALNYDFSKIKKSLAFNKPSAKGVFISFLLGVFLFVALQFTVRAVNFFVGDSAGSSNTSTQLSSLNGIWLFVTLLFITPFVVPFTEEFIFRGIIAGQFYRGVITKRFPYAEFLDYNEKKSDLALKEGFYLANEYVGEQLPEIKVSEANFKDLPSSRALMITKGDSDDHLYQKTRKKAIFLSVLVSSIIFGLAHIDGSGFFTFFWTGLLGALMSYVFITKNNFWYSFTIHASYNLVTSIALLSQALNL